MSSTPAFNKGTEISFKLALIRTNAIAYTGPKDGVNATMAMVKAPDGLTCGWVSSDIPNMKAGI